MVAYYSTLPPVMGEMLGNSIPVNLRSNGFTCQSSLYMPSNCEYKNYHCSQYSSLGVKMSRSQVGLCDVSVVSMSIKGYTGFRCVELKIPYLSSSFGSTKIAKLLAVSNLVASNDYGLVSEENENKEMIQRGHEVNTDCYEEYAPPWGNLMLYGELDMDPESIIQPSVASRNDSRNKVTIDDTRVHLLEETDGEELSRRILMLSRSNKVKSAIELFRSMEFSGIRPNGHACNSLISCLLRNKILDYALRVFGFTRRNEISTGHTYALILKAVADTQSIESSLNMFAELGGFSRENNDFDVIVYNTMISVCGRSNNWVDTERIWKSMKEKGLHGTQITYSLLVSIFVRCGQNELALDAYNEMDQNGIKPRDDTLQAVIGACAKDGKWELALCIFQNMLKRGLKPNLIACNALMNALGKAGELKLAFKVFEKVKSLGHTPDAYTWNALLNGLYRANQFADALQLFESIKRERSSQINEHLYNTALMSCQKLGLWDKALQLLWQLEASELPISTTSYNLVIGACEIARKPKVALQVYEHMVHQKCTPDTFTYLSLIRSCIWASLWSDVEEILDKVAPDVSLYNAVIHGMCLRGRVESAKKLYMKMRSRGLKPDGKTRAMMLQNLRKVSTKWRRYSHPRLNRSPCHNSRLQGRKFNVNGR
ncbi:hypothetical protein JCGZ_19910 [Jatropha curcas]|uniref:Pentacotripeptide-repeat region of PRORP domain-containing protein n=1 Tax=Jatropha curcas TaxID=180498 RepID=A0A067JTF0_JATCU|nr:pentatricopeptide repeat-containing protein At3g29290 [Jatropha curcas]XP_037491999.1 pentatricopeptide repeat-containing protein At3g29290 [Jatropha curcas]KDP27211.1 hypothetical protein JCGZ_19910 [Jatropha curcas]